MKRFSMAMTWLALAGLMTTVSCRKPVVGFTNGEARTVTVSAVTENGDGSKTSIDGLYVKWSEGDEISMNGCELTLEEGAGGTMGRFTGEVEGDGPYLIGYPAGKTTYSGTTLKLSIPASWAYDADMKEIVPMAAYAEKVGDDVQFRNAVNMLKLQLWGDGTAASKLTSIVLTSTTSNLSGDINVTFNGGVPEFAAIAGDGASKTMTVSFGEEGLQLKADEVKCVYIPLAKISVDDVLTVRFDCANGKYMEKNVTVDANFNGVNNMLSAPELMMGHEYVDLGLPSGLKWATCNIGADSPAECGDLFAWGETEPKTEYEWSNYKWGIGWHSYTKYVTNSWFGYEGFQDGKTTLELADDAASANWGGAWRMPTEEEWHEMLDNTYVEYVYDYADTGVNGIVVYKVKDAADKGLRKIDWNKYDLIPVFRIGKVDDEGTFHDFELAGVYDYSSDPHIFLPAFTEENWIHGGFQEGYYRTSSLSEREAVMCNQNGVCGEFAQDGFGSAHAVQRCYGDPVRPVQ